MALGTEDGPAIHQVAGILNTILIIVLYQNVLLDHAGVDARVSLAVVIVTIIAVHLGGDGRHRLRPRQFLSCGKIADDDGGKLIGLGIHEIGVGELGDGDALGCKVVAVGLQIARNDPRT